MKHKYLIVPAVKTGLEIRKNKNTLVPSLESFSAIKKKYKGTGITQTNIEIKNIIKVSRSLEKRGISLKGTTRKLNSQEGELLNYLAPLTRVSLPLTKMCLYRQPKAF